MPFVHQDILLKSAQVLNSTSQQSLESAMDSSRRSSNSEKSKHPFNLGEVFQDSISCGRKECLLNTNYMHTLQGSIVNSNDGTVSRAPIASLVPVAPRARTSIDSPLTDFLLVGWPLACVNGALIDCFMLLRGS